MFKRKKDCNTVNIVSVTQKLEGQPNFMNVIMTFPIMTFKLQQFCEDPQCNSSVKLIRSSIMHES